MTGSGRRAHDDLAVTIGFNTAVEPGKFAVSQEFLPAAQVTSRLRLLRWKFNRQSCHDLSLLLRCAPRQPVLTAIDVGQKAVRVAVAKLKKGGGAARGAHDRILRCRTNAAFRTEVERRICAAERGDKEICPAPRRG